MNTQPARARARGALFLTVSLLLLASLAACVAPAKPTAPGPTPASGSVDSALSSLAGTVTSSIAGTPEKPTATRAPAKKATATRTPAKKATATPQRRATATKTPNDGLATMAMAKLPKEARDTIRLIEKGGPFPYDQDGATFGNREGLLPKRPNGYYKEYTVKTPGSRDRGARRIVGGQGGELYYTDDHYDSFKRVIP